MKSDLIEDRSYLYGDGLFETIRVPASGGGEVRWLDRHLARLRASGRALGFPEEIIEQGCETLVSIAAIGAPGIWRVTVSRPGISDEDGMIDWGGTGGVSARYRPFVALERPRLGIARGYYWPDDALRVHKSTSFLRNVEARRYARLEGFDDVVLVSADGQVGEASAANVFVVCQGEVVTPALCGIVAGVTRAGILACAAKHECVIHERAVYIDELLGADEVIVVSAGIGVVSAASLLGRVLGDSWGRRMRGWLGSK